MKDTPEVSIVVSNYNSSDLMNGALESIVSTAGDVAFEVMVIDDASTDGGLTRVEKKYTQDPRFIFVQNEKNVGYGALNMALERTRAPYLMTLDTDARLLPGALRALITFMDANPGAGAATANLQNPDGSIQNYYRRLMNPEYGFYTTVLGRLFDKYLLGLRHYKAYHYDDLDTTRDFELEQPPTACLMLRREALGDQIVDPAFHVFIDVDLCKRIYDRGYKIFLVADAPVTHIKSAAFGKRESSWRRKQYYTNLNRYFKKHYPRQAPVLQFLLWLDRSMRFFLRHTLAHEPMR
jgi:GT2 family glycosyltransferase